MSGFFSDLWAFAVAALVNWAALFGGLGIALELIVHLKGWKVPAYGLRLTWVFLLVLAFFLAWREERSAKTTADQQRQSATVSLLAVTAQRDELQLFLRRSESLFNELTASRTSEASAGVQQITEAFSHLAAVVAARPTPTVSAPATLRRFRLSWAGRGGERYPRLRVSGPIIAHAVFTTGVRAWSETERRFSESPQLAAFPSTQLDRAFEPDVSVRDPGEGYYNVFGPSDSRSNDVVFASGANAPAVILPSNGTQWQISVRIVYGARAEHYEDSVLCFDTTGPAVTPLESCSS
jgi:hypothetical protein